MNKKITSFTVGALATAALTGLVAGKAIAEEKRADGLNGDTTATVAGTPAEPVKKDGASKNDCAGKNDCRGQGGCEASDQGCKGKNSCQGKGGCSAEMKDGTSGK